MEEEGHDQRVRESDLHAIPAGGKKQKKTKKQKKKVACSTSPFPTVIKKKVLYTLYNTKVY